ncbi:hypothetical protein JMN32_15935 [Fulvivirga sp. 29W222]|uniref:Uncharacterized protein n=1 Tax=Fulvivirga marina TaxID=2494733 RepID=A0A937G0M5_9BACT|nr:hypothetical protein [Fulvivirga marina]MBL6447810.1 hypothetical protein [Fulvivirga marina]
MTTTLKRGYDNFNECFEEFKSASELTKKEKAQKLISQIDILSKTREGLKHLYNKSLEIESAGFFADTAWHDPEKLAPVLVKGTLTAGSPTATYEIMSELRMLAHSKADTEPEISKEDAGAYLEEVLVHNLEFAFQELTEETRTIMNPQEVKRVYNLFSFLVKETGLQGIKDKLSEEIQLICEQRPVVTRKAREIIHMVSCKMELNPEDEADKQLLYYVHAVNSPTSLSRQHADPEGYAEALKQLNDLELLEEAEKLAAPMRATGLVTPFTSAMLLHLTEVQPDLIPKALLLNKRGQAEWSKHKELVIKLIGEVVSIDSFQCIYGLARVLEKSLLSRNAVKASLNNLRMISINSQVEKRILKCQTKPRKTVTAKQYLLAATLRVLGQPLGIGQGNNSTCQSARGISMWSQHSPAKLINMIITVAAQNNLILRFENIDLESNKLTKGLVDKLDYNLDAVSAVLVPHLDKIYNEMMRLASGRGEDPHKWVNPALYGHWIQIGFASAYSYLTNAIQDFKGFVRLFYAALHPEYNGGREIVYPNPLGIFVTSRAGAMIGFHAVSLLHVGKDDDGVMRAYFLNPNNEGRQDWGQGIKPSVYGHGEKHGVSSLPFQQFAARVYAFHFNSLETMAHLDSVPNEEIEKVEKLARGSWGKSYIWSELKKQW